MRVVFGTASAWCTASFLTHLLGALQAASYICLVHSFLSHSSAMRDIQDMAVQLALSVLVHVAMLIASPPQLSRPCQTCQATHITLSIRVLYSALSNNWHLSLIMQWKEENSPTCCNWLLKNIIVCSAYYYNLNMHVVYKHLIWFVFSDMMCSGIAIVERIFNLTNNFLHALYSL